MEINSGCMRDHFRRAGTADMMVKAQHFVGFRHHQMQVVGDHQHGAVQFVAQLVDQIVERDLAINVHTLRWLIQHQQLRAA